MIKRKPTLVMTAIMLVISILLLSTASLAWFTISKAPEISGMRVTLFTDRALLVSKTANPEDFTQSIDLSECFQYLAPLKPISTYDGVHWFKPAYGADGNLVDPSDYTEELLKDILADPEINMNVPLYKEDEDGNMIPLEGLELFNAKNNGYYVSCEFYLATELTEDVTVTLSVPNRVNSSANAGKENGNLEDWELKTSDPHGAKYGSYALASYGLEFDKDGNKTGAATIDNNAQTALRIGFMTYTDNENPESRDKFTIYEPNADLRSRFDSYDSETGELLFQKPPEANGYVYGYTINTATYKDGRYIPTLPIKAKLDAEGKVIGAEVAALSPTGLIVQRACKWKESELMAKVAASSIDKIYKPNSNDVDTFGKFVKTTSDLNIGSVNNIHDFDNTVLTDGFDLASSTQIVTLKGRVGDTIQPKKITMYIWIEGQDADCWNDIANGTFAVNLEFAAKETEEVSE